MDAGTSAAVCITVITFGGLVLSLLRFFKSKNGHSIPTANGRKDFMEEVREEFVAEKTCKANIKRIEQVLDITSKGLSKEITTLGVNIGKSLDDIKAKL